MHQLLTNSGIALAIMAVLAVALGWLVTGRSPVMYGYASNIGDGPTIPSDNELDGDHRGPNPP